MAARAASRASTKTRRSAELARGSSPKFMNGQFRYYLAGVSIAEPAASGCKTPLLAIRLAIENLHGTATSAIHGSFTFGRSPGSDDVAPSAPVGSPFPADILGPFSDKRGGTVYVTAYASIDNPAADPARWAEITAIDPGRLKVWFRPDAFYYPGGQQYALRTGDGPASREPVPCGGADGATLARR